MSEYRKIRVADLNEIFDALGDYGDAKRSEYAVSSKAFLVTGDSKDRDAAKEALGFALGLEFAITHIHRFVSGDVDAVNDLELLAETEKKRQIERANALDDEVWNGK